MSPPKGFDPNKPEWQLIFEMIADLNQKMDDHITDSISYREAVAAKMAGDQHLIDTLVKAFPNDDPVEHRKEHEDKARNDEELADLLRTVKKEVAKWGVIGILGFILVAAWKAFLLGPAPK